VQRRVRLLCAFVIRPCVIHRQVTAENKIDAPKENQCTTRWLLTGFLSQETFYLLFWSRNHLEMLNWFSLQFKLTKYRLLILERKIHILAQKKKRVPSSFYLDPTFSTGTLCFTSAPCFPHPVFSTDPGTPYPVPRPHVFHLAGKKDTPRFNLTLLKLPKSQSISQIHPLIPSIFARRGLTLTTELLNIKY